MSKKAIQRKIKKLENYKKNIKAKMKKMKKNIKKKEEYFMKILEFYGYPEKKNKISKILIHKGEK